MNIRQITTYAMLIALTVALSLTILIPVPATNGFVTLCEVGIYTASSLFGPLGGLVVGGSSGLLIDLISGYPQWAIFSLLIHGSQGLIVGLIGRQTMLRWFLGLLTGSVVMITGYLLAGWFLYGWPAGVASIPGNMLQNLFGIALTYPLVSGLKRFQLGKQR